LEVLHDVVDMGLGDELCSFDHLPMHVGLRDAIDDGAALDVGVGALDGMVTHDRLDVHVGLLDPAVDGDILHLVVLTLPDVVMGHEDLVTLAMKGRGIDERWVVV